MIFFFYITFFPAYRSLPRLPEGRVGRFVGPCISIHAPSAGPQEGGPEGMVEGLIRGLAGNLLA